MRVLRCIWTSTFWACPSCSSTTLPPASSLPLVTARPPSTSLQSLLCPTSVWTFCSWPVSRWALPVWHGLPSCVRVSAACWPWWWCSAASAPSAPRVLCSCSRGICWARWPWWLCPASCSRALSRWATSSCRASSTPLVPASLQATLPPSS